MLFILGGSMFDFFGKRVESFIREEFGDLLVFLEWVFFVILVEELISLVSWMFELENLL